MCSNEMHTWLLRHFVFLVFIRRGKEVLASKGFISVVNTQFYWLDEAGFLYSIVMPTLQSMLHMLRQARCVPPPHHPYVISCGFSRDNSKMSWVPRHSGTTECSIELISITSAYYWSAQNNTRLFWCRMSKHLTPKVVTFCYLITLHSAFG